LRSDVSKGRATLTDCLSEDNDRVPTLGLEKDLVELLLDGVELL
jgi:hypothetical protein